MLHAPEQVVQAAQAELESYLEQQAKAIAGIKIERVNIDGATYLTATDENLPEEGRIRLMVLLEDGMGHEKVVDLSTNNDRFSFVCSVIRQTFDREWRIVEDWEPEDAPF